MINGIDVILYERTASGTDNFGAITYTETATTVSNVLVTPVSAADVINTTQLDGKTAVYELCIPKGDEHEWENRRVEFFGETWETVGPVREYIEANVPLFWNKKVQVKRFE